jgi:methyl-accepting chemotaxis protein
MEKIVKKSFLIGYLFIFVITSIFIQLVNYKSKQDYQTALNRYIFEAQQNTIHQKLRLENSLKQIQQNLRTISFLPSVRNIDRHGSNLDDNAHESIQQIYNNLRTNVDVSEVYIVPVDLEPENIDPITKEPEAPILMFDKLIMSPEDRKKEQESNIPQIEIYEYRALKAQMTWLKEHFPNILNIDKISPPILTSNELITCDNSYFLESRKDADRSGIIFSVPFYSFEGKLKGTISAIILTNNLRKIFQSTDYALINTNNKYFVAKDSSIALEYKDLILRNNPTGLIYSEKLKLDINTLDTWQIWAGEKNANFLNSIAVESIKIFKTTAYFAIIVTSFIFIFLVFISSKKAKEAMLDKIALENTISERTKKIENLAQQQKQHQQELEDQRNKLLNDISNSLEQSVQERVSQILDATLEMQKSAQESFNSVNNNIIYSQQASQSSITATKASSEISEASKELYKFIREINLSSQNSEEVVNLSSDKAKQAKASIDLLYNKSEQVNKIISLISDISKKINLLALNATIESARAGEAGKGFAVVANEVKNLSSQVAKASNEIEKQMTDIKASVADSVKAVDDIFDTIAKVSSNFKNISSSITRQTDATNNITHNIILSADTIGEIAGKVDVIKSSSEESKKSSNNVLETAKQLLSNISELHEQIKDFISRIKQA